MRSTRTLIIIAKITKLDDETEVPGSETQRTSTVLDADGQPVKKKRGRPRKEATAAQTL